MNQDLKIGANNKLDNVIHFFCQQPPGSHEQATGGGGSSDGEKEGVHCHSAQTASEGSGPSTPGKNKARKPEKRQFE